MLVNLCSSVTAGAIGNLIMSPVWTVRTRMMTQIDHRDYRNPFHAARKIYKTEGLQALYRGLVPSLWGLVNCFHIFIKTKLEISYLLTYALIRKFKII